MSLTLLAGLVVILAAGVALAGGGLRARGGTGRTADFEAKLRPIDDVPAAADARGKAERETWSDGASGFEARVTGIALPDGSEVEFVVADIVLGRVGLQDGCARLAFSSRNGQSVPPVEAGLSLEIRHEGTVLLAGAFRRD